MTLKLVITPQLSMYLLQENNRYRAMKRSVLITLLLILSTTVFAAKVGSATTALGLTSSVPTGTGVVVPEGVTLVGNLAIQYQYGEGTPWEYVSTKELSIGTIGLVEDSVTLQVLYYGNEPDTYSCSVAFTSNGWKRDGDKDSQSLLPIHFRNLSVVNNEKFASTANDSGFSLVVPVSSPINGASVATVVAYWGTADLPSGQYAASIEITVSSP